MRYEKIYKVMGSCGAGSLIVGIISVAAGVAVGVISIINGARLLKHKSEIL